VDDDILLLRRYVETRAEAAFTKLVQRRIGLVYALALRQTQRTDLAKDASQQVFSALARHASTLARRESLVGWLYLTATHAGVDLGRAERSRRRREEAYQAMVELQNTRSPDPDWDQTRPLLNQIVSELSDADRTTLLLRYVDGQSYSAVGQRLRLSENAARMKVERTLKKLRAKLARLGIASSAAALESALAVESLEPAGTGAWAAAVAHAAIAPAGAASGLIGWIALMSSLKLSTTVIGSALGLMALAIAIAGWQDHLARVQLDQAQRDFKARWAQVQSTEARLKQARSALASLKPAPSAANPKLLELAAHWNPRQEGENFLRRHPEVRPLWEEQRRTDIRARYAGLIRSLQLTDEQQRAFEQLLLPTISMNVPYGPHGLPLSFVAGEGTDSSGVEQQLQKLLGTAGYDAYRNYDINSSQEMAGSVAENLAWSEPLTAEQTQKLVEVFAIPNLWRRNDDSLFRNWTKILSSAATFLSPSQLGALTELQTEEQLKHSN